MRGWRVGRNGEDPVGELELAGAGTERAVGRETDQAAGVYGLYHCNTW